MIVWLNRLKVVPVDWKGNKILKILKILKLAKEEELLKEKCHSKNLIDCLFDYWVTLFEEMDFKYWSFQVLFSFIPWRTLTVSSLENLDAKPPTPCLFCYSPKPNSTEQDVDGSSEYIEMILISVVCQYHLRMMGISSDFEIRVLN